MKTQIKSLRFYVIFMAFSFMGLSLNAQIHERLQREGNLNFQQITDQSEQYFDQVGRGKGVGYKQFQRWKYWAERNLDANGKVRNTLDALNSYKKFSLENQNNNSSQRNLTGNYTELGPLTSVYTSTWSSGLGRISAVGLDPNDDNHIIVGSPTGGIWKTTNLGGVWTPLFDDQANIDVYALEISHSNSNHYWAGLDGGLVRSIDGGNNWTNVTGVNSDLFNTITMHPTDSNIIFAVGQYSDRVYKSSDGGSSFSIVTDVSSDLFDLEFHPSNSNIIYASGNNIVLISTNGGNSFTEITNAPWVSNGSGNALMMAVTSAAPNNLYVLEEQNGGFNALYLSQDSGATWSILDSYDGTNNIMGYDQNVQSGQAPRDMDIIVSPLNANIVHVAGVETWRSNDLGQNWTKTTRWNNPGGSDFIHADIDLLIYDGNRIVAGTDGGIHFSTDEANTWTDISAGLAIRQFYRIGAAQTDIDRVSGGSQDNGTGTLVNGTWRDWLGADGMETFIDWNNADIIYGTSQNGTFYKSTDGGMTRSSISNSIPSGNWVTPFEQDPSVSTTIYAAADEIYKSTDSGSSWATISNFSNGDLADEMKISTANSNYIYVSYGTNFYTSTNGGTSWTTTNIPAGSRLNYITVHPTDALRLAVTISGSSNKIYESFDAGASWTNITRNIPSGVTIECVLYDGADGGLYAGGNPGIYHKSSSVSADYVDVSQNLPKVRVTELEIRNQVLYAGTYGRGLWKYELNCDGSLEGQTCNDFDGCTVNDVYDENCNCAGTVVTDSDNDGVCDTIDQCPGFDDNIDIDQDGIPDGCDTSIDCDSCDTTINTFPHIEDFENGTSELCQFTSDDLDWTISSGSTPSSATGPSAAYSGNNYFYAESSDPNYPSKRTTFKGTCYNVQNANSASINFWYHMYGATINELKLDISSDGGSTYTTVWTQNGNQGDQWLNANIDLTAYISSELSYAFTITTGSNWESDIAVDLITVDASFDTCVSNGGDSDGDGICADLDCDDSDPNIGGEGSSCDDGDDCTENDVLDADCNCSGTIIIADTDGDGILDCLDQEINSPCPQDVDANGISNDDDNDGIANCNDSCDDSIDSDGDGTPDCIDNCDNDPNKTEPGDCGCGEIEADTDGDGVLDCNDQEINSPCPLDVDADGISNDDDNDGICNINDICPGGDDTIDTDGDGIPDFCDSPNCSSTTNTFQVGQLTHSGSGSGTTNLTLSGGTHTEVSFSITEINSRLGGKPGNRFNERVTISYVDGNGITQNYGTFNGDVTSSVNVSISGEVQSISIALSDAYDGNSSTTMRITLGEISSCVALNCTDTDGDGICDTNDICPGFDDNLIGTPCDDGDNCTINDVYTNDCNCAGTYVDSDNDGICDGDDICPGGDDNVDLNGNGIPDDCDCTNGSDDFSASSLNNSGGGSNNVSYAFTNPSTSVAFSISGLDARINGNPRNRYEEVVNVTYTLASGDSQTLAYSGANTNVANVNIEDYITQVNITLSNGVSGSSATLGVNLSGIDFCAQNSSPSGLSPGQELENNNDDLDEIDLKIFPNPANTEINISFASPRNRNYSIEVKSILGQTVYKTKVNGSDGVSNTKLSATNWQSGMYFIIINTETDHFVEKVVIRH